MILKFIGKATGITTIFNIAYYSATFLPSIAVATRRMHDIGKRVWFSLIPVYNLILACKEGDRHANEYGEDPKYNINTSLNTASS